jgi:hypothetical protein
MPALRRDVQRWPRVQAEADAVTPRDAQDYVAELVAISEYQTGANGRPRVPRSETASTASTPAGVVVDLDAPRRKWTR